MSDALHAGATLGQLIVGAIRRFDHAPALSDETSSWTYAEFGEAIARCVAVLRSLGLRKGDGLAIAAGNRAEQVAAALADRGLLPADFEGPHFSRIAHLRALLADGRVGPDLRWREGAWGRGSVGARERGGVLHAEALAA